MVVEGAMFKFILKGIMLRRPFVRGAAAASLPSVAQSANDFAMHDIYHHGLCTQGRLALQIGADDRRQLRRAKIIDAVVLALWGLGLLSLMWLGTARSEER